MNARMQTTWLVVGLLALVAPVAAAESVEEELPAINIDHKDWPAAKHRFERITTELTAPAFRNPQTPDWAKDWAGNYCNDGGPGKIVSIALAPKSGVAYCCSGCVSVYDANEGEIVAVAPDGVTVRWLTDPKKTPRAYALQGYLSPKLFFVRWGDRRYLIPEGQMPKLIAHYNQGGKARGTLWDMPLKRDPLLQNGSPQEQAVPPGRPELPANFAKYIVDRPTRLTVRAAKVADRRDGTDIEKPPIIQGEVELVTQPDAQILVGAEIDWFSDVFSGSITIDKVDNTKLSGKFTGMFRTAAARLPPAGSEIILPGAAPDAQ